jgi:hypothetical protein
MPANHDPGSDQIEVCILILRLANDMFGSAEDQHEICNIEHALQDTLATQQLGKLTTVVTGGGYCKILLEGHSADALYQCISDIIDLSLLPEGSSITRRYGPPGARSITTRF